MNESSALRRRWRYEVVGIFMMLGLGIIYGWSNFIVPMQEDMGWRSDQIALAYSIATTMHCFGSLFGGVVAKKIGGKKVLVIGMVIMILGFLLASSANSILVLCVGYGFCVGSGAGMGYNALIGLVVPWFPDKKGLASGLLFMSFGFCSMVFGLYAVSLITSFGWRGAFRIVGIAYGLAIIVLGMFLKPVGKDDVLPEAESSAQGDSSFQPMNITGWELVKRPSFIAFFFWGALMCGCGLLMIGHASPIAQEIGFSAGNAAVLAGVLTGFNGIGRVIFGRICDKKGTAIVMAAGSILFIIGSLLMYFSIRNTILPLMVIAFIIMGFAYGSITPTTTSVMAGFYGMEYYAINVGIANINVFPASFGGPFISGIMVQNSGSYASTALFVFALSIGALILGRFVRRP
jgi:OFA family oxalate/formate antiporter-like MFS transporter